MSEMPADLIERYGGYNPAFVRNVWKKRRASDPRTSTPRAPTARINRRGVRSKHWTDDERQQVIEMIRRGLSFAEIGKHFGRSKGSVAGMVDRNPWMRKSRRIQG